MQLEYLKGERIFEDNLVDEIGIEDLNKELIDEYKKYINASHLSTEAVLKARQFIKSEKLTVACVLLFCDNASLIFPQSRVRFLRYEGVKKETGERLNLIKDQNFEGSLISIIRNLKIAIKGQLRDFQFLNKEGKFVVIPEYPEFAWFEGVINAITHRDYSFTGDYIRITMYDDRLEIFSPGSLPNIVTLKNMRYTRYARNPKIARTLAYFGWVRELNEGINRIYDEMEKFYLKKPEYTEPNKYSLQLKLENNYETRNKRIKDKADEYINKFNINDLTINEHKIIEYLYVNDKITVKLSSSILKISNKLSRKILKSLLEKNMIKWYGNSNNDPKQYYTLND